MMDGRTFIGAFAGGLVTARSVAEAQPAAKVYRVGVLLVATAETVAPLVRALTEGVVVATIPARPSLPAAQ